ncbi:urease accessory protein UreD [Amycolatopsis rubida]|uniref:Urease accessory protein UreD n=1 Tax=Amycolatopsis rubida TaxID=112413 RepID=A0ABX0C4K5_9PSEU|nr:urease accessory protein UreD [Amycolatopsis sp. M39]MYW95358.1 urease accessory protein UreD [Amycolatopsis rubida]NEC60347.1 urease accessory protein UreD [Amycolatopsis rubida]OAP28237.1 Urease accessory protein UreD [Amycolatopsis sp. M39]
MKAHARLVAALDDGRTVLRELKSMAPLTLVPRRRRGPGAVVHLVNSATAPLGGDELRLDVHVGAGAELKLSGVAATLALPGLRAVPSWSTVEVIVEDGGCFEYLPEPTVVTARAEHVAVLRADLAADARFRTREVLVLGREGERPGRLSTTVHVTCGGVPALRQTQTVGDALLDASLAVLARQRVLVTEVEFGGECGPAESGPWWSRTPLAAGGTVTTALAPDVVTATALDRSRTSR